MKETLQFKTREEFRIWLSKHHKTSEGIWVLFYKTKEVACIKASEALEEALCFGWIDGLMKKVDDQSYVKYFSARRPGSKWSLKNKKLTDKLEQQGLMCDAGREKIAEAKANGQWDLAKKPSAIGEDEINQVAELLKGNTLAYENFLAMSPSVKKTYTRAYQDAKTEEGRQKRLAWMIDRLEKNLKPM